MPTDKQIEAVQIVLGRYHHFASVACIREALTAAEQAEPNWKHGNLVRDGGNKPYHGPIPPKQAEPASPQKDSHLREVIAKSIKDAGRANSMNKALFVIGDLSADGYIIMSKTDLEAIRDKTIDEINTLIMSAPVDMETSSHFSSAIRSLKSKEEPEALNNSILREALHKIASFDLKNSSRPYYVTCLEMIDTAKEALGESDN